MHTIGHYRILERLGVGGMGAVYRAQHTTLTSRIVAIKVLSDAVASQPQIRQRFLREAEIMAALHHENIVTLHDFLVLEDLYAIVMELVPGVTLDRWAGAQPVAFERAAPLLRQILAALEHAHRSGVVHRDVKPSNVLVTPEGRVKVTDFGIARLAQSPHSDLTRTGVGIGTPYYMSPEQIQGRRDVQAASDIYACGVLVHRLLSGRVPFDSDDETGFGILEAHVNRPPPPLRRSVPAVPPEVERAVLRALSKRPEDRWPSCAAFSHAMGLATLAEVQESQALPSRSLTPASDATLLPDAPSSELELSQGEISASGMSGRRPAARSRWRRRALGGATGLALAAAGAFLVAQRMEKGSGPVAVDATESAVPPPVQEPTYEASAAPQRAPEAEASPKPSLPSAAEAPPPAGTSPETAPSSEAKLAADAVLLRAEAQLDAGSPAAALATLEPLLTANPRDERALELRDRARSAKASQEHREAEARRREASAKWAEARSFLAKGKIDLAQRSLDEAARLFPAAPETGQIRSAIEKARLAERQAWAEGGVGQPVISKEGHQ